MKREPRIVSVKLNTGEVVSVEEFGKADLSQYFGQDKPLPALPRTSVPFSLDIKYTGEKDVSNINILDPEIINNKYFHLEYSRIRLNETYADFLKLIGELEDGTCVIGITFSMSSNSSQAFNPIEIINNEKSRMINFTLDPMQNQGNVSINRTQFDLCSTTKLIVKHLHAQTTWSLRFYPMTLPAGIDDTESDFSKSKKNSSDATEEE